MAIGNMYKEFGEVRPCGFPVTRADRKTDMRKPTYASQYCGYQMDVPQRDRDRLTVEVAVETVVQQRGRAEVDEADVAGVQVDDDVLVLDVEVDDAGVAHRAQRRDDAREHRPRVGVVERAAPRDVVEQVLAARRPLDDQHVSVSTPEVVDQVQHARNAGDLPQQRHLLGHQLSVSLKRFNDVQPYIRILKSSPFSPTVWHDAIIMVRALDINATLVFRVPCDKV